MMEIQSQPTTLTKEDVIKLIAEFNKTNVMKHRKG